MSAAGLFANERVELLDGTIVTMSPHTTHHAGTIACLQQALAATLGDAVHLRVRLPIVLDDWSEPEPDLAICTRDPRDYFDEHPRPEQVLVACEVAVSSLPYDRTEKAAAYAASGIPECWIVDVAGRVVHLMSDPDRAARRYRRETTVPDGNTIAAPGGSALAVANILPPR